MSNDWKKLKNVSAWVSPYDVFKPAFIEDYDNGTYVVRLFDRKPLSDQQFSSLADAENLASRDGRTLIEEHVLPLFNDNGNDIPTGQIFEYWYKKDAAVPYYVIINMTPGEKVTVQSLMGDNKALFEFDSYEQARIALWQDIYERVDELDPD